MLCLLLIVSFGTNASTQGAPPTVPREQQTPAIPAQSAPLPTPTAHSPLQAPDVSFAPAEGSPSPQPRESAPASSPPVQTPLPSDRKGPFRRSPLLPAPLPPPLPRRSLRHLPLPRSLRRRKIPTRTRSSLQKPSPPFKWDAHRRRTPRFGGEQRLRREQQYGNLSTGQWKFRCAHL